MREFKVPRADYEPLDFALTYERFKTITNEDGTETSEWVQQSDKFKARGTVAGNLLVSISASAAGGIALQAHEIQRLLSKVIVPEDNMRFANLIDDDDVAVPIETLGEIIEWLAEEYTARPTQSA